MNRGSWIGIVLLLLIGGAAVFAPRAGWFIGETLRGGSGGAFAPADVDALRLENAALRADRAIIEGAGLSAARSSDALASVYSRYPFNLKHELLISRGSETGEAPGDAVGVVGAGDLGAGCNVLIGKITKVYAKSALVQTIFDPQFQLAVRIGSRGVDGLLKGGNEPLVTLISQKAKVGAGDAVFAASSETPYGMALGTIADVRPSGDQVFQNAVLTVPYDVNAVRAVCVRKPPAA